MIWRHLAYQGRLLGKLEADAEPLVMFLGVYTFLSLNYHNSSLGDKFRRSMILFMSV